jgi:hypothetical protein
MAEEASSVPNNKKSNNILYAIPCDFRSKSLSAIDRKRASRMSRACHMTSPLPLCRMLPHRVLLSPPNPTFPQIPSTNPYLAYLLTYKFSLPKSPPKKKAGEVLSLLSLLA